LADFDLTMLQMSVS